MKRACLARLLAATFAVMILTGSAYAGDVTIAWDPNVETDIAGYLVWYGTRPGVYASSIDVGNRTVWAIAGLPDGQRYYFAVQAYNAARLMSPLSAEVVADLTVQAPAATPGTTGACRTVRPGTDWTCDPATGNWLPPGFQGSSTGTSGASTGFCKTVRPGVDWTCDPATGNWLPPGWGGTNSATSSGAVGGSSGACKTVRPGTDWTCDGATGNWLPPGSGGASSEASAAKGSETSGESARGCKTVRPGADWSCDTATGNWLPPGYRANQGSGAGEALYLYQPVSGVGLTGWIVLVPDPAAPDRFDALRNNVKIGQWSVGPAAGASQFTYAGRTGDPGTPGVADLFAWQPSTGLWYVLKSADGTVYTSQASLQWGDGASGDIPVPGDYDGDRKTDLAVWWPSTATWYALKSTEGYDSRRSLTIQWGESGDVPVRGDYDGDGKTDLSLWRPATATWLVLKSAEGYDTRRNLAVQWGESGDVPVQGDYDGDGKTDLAVWRPATATWFVLKSTEAYDVQRSYSVQWGESGDVPVQGDYDGDGKTDIAVWRPSTLTSLVLKSSEGFNLQRCLAVQWGAGTGVSPCPVTITVK